MSTCGVCLSSLLLRILRDYARQHLPGYALALVLMALVAASTAAAAYLMKDVINQIFIARNQSAILMLAGAVVGLYLVKGFALYGQEIVLTRIGRTIVADIQVKMFAHLLAKTPAFFMDRHSSEFIAQQSLMANSAQSAIHVLVTGIGRDALTVLALLAVMIVQDPWMSFGALTVLPVALVGIGLLLRKIKRIVRREFEGTSATLETLQESVRGFHIVKAFALESVMQARFKQAVTTTRKAGVKLASVKAAIIPLVEVLGGIAVAGIILYGGWRVVYHGQSAGEFFSFITAFLLAYDPARRLARMNADLNSAMVGVEMLYTFLGTPADEPAHDTRPPLQVSGGEIRFENVYFAYRPDEPVLAGVSFTVRAGKTTALIGPSGSGKSTIFSLLQAFLHPQAGHIHIDGQALDAHNLASVRAQIAVVSQDAFLFKGSIGENIAYGRLGASQDEIIAAAKAAHAHDFIAEFADGYASQVGEQGANLSGGQRQRIALARAFLKQAPIILLDEATSALDVTSERLVREAIRTLGAGRTVLLIAHRPETYQEADHILDLAVLRDKTQAEGEPIRVMQSQNAKIST